MSKTIRKSSKKITSIERAREIMRLREQLSDPEERFTAQEFASLRGRIGGLRGYGSPGRRLGGQRGAAARAENARRRKTATQQQEEDSVELKTIIANSARRSK